MNFNINKTAFIEKRHKNKDEESENLKKNERGVVIFSCKFCNHANWDMNKYQSKCAITNKIINSKAKYCPNHCPLEDFYFKGE